jgi:putative membrane protein
LFVIGWLSGLFVLPRVLLLWKVAFEGHKNTDAIQSLAIKLFRFGSLLAVLAMSLGAWLWVGYGVSGKWLQIKLVLVALLVLYHLLSGWLLLRAVRFNSFGRNWFLRIFNESPLLLVLPIIYLAVAKIS